jgi:hypothetical protein
LIALVVDSAVGARYGVARFYAEADVGETETCTRALQRPFVAVARTQKKLKLAEKGDGASHAGERYLGAARALRA